MNMDLINNCDTVVLDLDGVVYKGNSLIKGADIAINKLRKAGKKIKFITNNSSIGSSEVSRKINSLGIDCNKEDAMSSATASAIYLSENNYDNIFVVGSNALVYEVRKFGMNVTLNPRHADALLVGMDKEISYQKISDATLCVNLGCHFVACNKDSNYPIEEGITLPGCGPIVVSIECASEKNIDFHVGKPDVYMLEKLLKKYTLTPEKILVIGDSINSDVEFAKKCNTQAIHICSDYSHSSFNYEDGYFRFSSLQDVGDLILSN
jgi:HAD superfamily hydrolase (TIGR01450 family)